MNSAPPNLQTRKESFAVRSYATDATGLLAPPALVGYLLELARVHAEELGLGVEALRARGLTWVLGRLRVELSDAVALDDTIELETWPSGVERLFALRDFRIRKRGVVIGRAASQWLLFGIESRRAVWPDAELSQLVVSAEKTFEEPFIKFGPLVDVEQERAFESRFRDIDYNLHVTSTSYVAWALEAIPLEIWQSARLSFLEVQYMAECMHPCRVMSRARKSEDGNFHHAILREGEKNDAARLVTKWAPR
jgi:acyl-ACP thioesterase